MAEMFSSLTHAAGVLLAVAILWLSGFLMTRVTKIFKLPNVTGYLLAGMVIGPYVLHLIPNEIIAGMDFVTDIALSFIAFGVGKYLRLDRLKQQGGRIIMLTLMEALIAAAMVTLCMLYVFHLSLSFSLLLGAIASATAPASSLMTIRQYRAKGDFVNTLVQVVALDDAVALLAFSLCAAVAANAERAVQMDWRMMLAPLWLNLAVLLVSFLLGRLLCAMLHGRSSDHRLVLLCTFVFLLAAGCSALEVSPLMGCMMLGATVSNVSGDTSLFKQANHITPPINVLFFVLSGMSLNLPALQTVGVIGVGYFFVRILGKYLGAYLGAVCIKASREVRRYLGLALIPQAGVSIGLAVLAQRILPEGAGALLSTIILSSSVLYEMIGPVCARKAMMLSGAISADALLMKKEASKNPPEKEKKVVRHEKKEDAREQKKIGDSKRKADPKVTQAPMPLAATQREGAHWATTSARMWPIRREKR
ncbi:MAG: cation:proton antiporter [Clostridia bacterium]